MSQPPLLRLMPLTGKPVVLLRYTRRGDGTLRAVDRREVEPWQVLRLVDELGVSDATLNDVADKLGLERDVTMSVKAPAAAAPDPYPALAVAMRRLLRRRMAETKVGGS